MPRPVKFTGRVIKAAKSRGPQNKEFTRDDLVKLIPKLPGTQLMYNHGDDTVIGKKSIGKIESAYIDHEDFLVVRGVTDDGSNIGEEAFNRIRNELLDSTLPMMSIHWKAKTLNRTTDESAKIANPDTKDVKEISLVHQGYYAGADIMEVACSGDKLWWKTDVSVYTDANQTTSSKPPSMAFDPAQHAVLLKLAKISEEEQKKLDHSSLAAIYAELLPSLASRISEYEKKEKREREAYETAQTKEAESLLSGVLDIFPEEHRPKAQEHLSSIAKNYEQREVWNTLKPMLQHANESKRKLSELQAQQPAPVADEMSMAASLQRGMQSEAKRTAPMSLEIDPALEARIKSRLRR